MEMIKKIETRKPLTNVIGSTKLFGLLQALCK
jgi:hypothetical protein